MYLIPKIIYKAFDYYKKTVHFKNHESTFILPDYLGTL